LHYVRHVSTVLCIIIIWLVLYMTIREQVEALIYKCSLISGLLIVTLLLLYLLLLLLLKLPFLFTIIRYTEIFRMVMFVSDLFCDPFAFGASNFICFTYPQFGKLLLTFKTPESTWLIWICCINLIFRSLYIITFLALLLSFYIQRVRLRFCPDNNLLVPGFPIGLSIWNIFDFHFTSFCFYNILNYVFS